MKITFRTSQGVRLARIASTLRVSEPDMALAYMAAANLSLPYGALPE